MQAEKQDQDSLAAVGGRQPRARELSVADQERIVRITALLAGAWRVHPEYRLGQLISNLLGPGPRDVFGVPDETWDRLLKARQPTEEAYAG